jgi:TetR/AcrR family transcriptional regulator
MERSTRQSDRRPGRTSGAAQQLQAGGVNETAERILVTALATFADRGFDGATTRDIAAAAKVNVGLIPYYFGDKEALWKAAVDRVFSELASELRAAAEKHAGAGDGGAAELLRTCVRFAARRPAFVRLMNDEGKRSGPRMRWLVDNHARALFDVAVEAIRRAGKRNVLREVPAVHIYYMLIGAIGMIFSQAPECRRITGVDPTRDARSIDTHADAVVRLFLG